MPNYEPCFYDLTGNLVDEVTLVAFSHSFSAFFLALLNKCSEPIVLALCEGHPGAAQQTQQDVHICTPMQPNITAMVILSATIRAC